MGKVGKMSLLDIAEEIKLEMACRCYNCGQIKPKGHEVSIAFGDKDEVIEEWFCDECLGMKK